MVIGRPAEDISGRTFGRLTVLSRAGSKAIGGHATWLCRCQCGAETTVTGYKLRSLKTSSCGCLARELSSKRAKTHGLSKHRLFPTWDGMMQRCYNSTSAPYREYGGRGIFVCAEWHD